MQISGAMTKRNKNANKQLIIDMNITTIRVSKGAALTKHPDGLELL